MSQTITVDGDEVIDATIDGEAVEEITIDGDLAWAAAVGLDGLTVTRQDGSYTASSGEHVVSNGGTITLPSPVQDGIVMITKVQTTPELSGSVDGITDPYISGDDSVVFVSEGSAWYSVDRNQISAIPDSGNLQAQYAARNLSGYSDGDTVDPFTDSAGSHDATATGGPAYRTNEINGQPAVDYDGNDDAHDTGIVFDTSNARSIYLVLSVTGSGINYGANPGNNRTYVRIEPGSSRYLHVYADESSRVGSPPSDTYLIYSQVASSGSSTAYENNSPINTISYAGGGSLGITDYIGAENQGSQVSGHSNCNVAEILLYQADHDQSTRQAVWDYLNNIYGIF